MATIYYAATSLDGRLAEVDDSLGWLFAQQQDRNGPLNYDSFYAGVGALVMGATTYSWLVNEVNGISGWPYPGMPVWVLTHRELEAVDEGVRFASGPVVDLHPQLVAAAGEKDVWVVGGGDLAAQFADAGLLDELQLYLAAVTLGEGRPLFPRRRALELLQVERNGDFAVLRYGVGAPLPPLAEAELASSSTR